MKRRVKLIYKNTYIYDFAAPRFWWFKKNIDRSDTCISVRVRVYCYRLFTLHHHRELVAKSRPYTLFIPILCVIYNEEEASYQFFFINPAPTVRVLWKWIHKLINFGRIQFHLRNPRRVNFEDKIHCSPFLQVVHRFMHMEHASLS